MPTNRILPTLAVAIVVPVWAWAQGPAAPPSTAPAPDAAKAKAEPADDKPTPAEDRIDEAIAKVRALKSVATDIHEDVKMLGLQYTVQGQYLRAADMKVRLRLDVVGLSNVTGTFLQVCDGSVFWEYRKVLESTDIRRHEIAPIMEKLQSPDCTPELREQVLSTMGLAGPDALLSGLRKEIGFDQMEESLLDGRKVLVIRGRWKDRDKLNSSGQPKLSAVGPLPPYVPSLAEVWLDQGTGWPYRVKLTGRAPSIMETKKAPSELGNDGRPLARVFQPMTKVEPSELVLNYTNVTLSPKIDPAEFAYEPPRTAGTQIQDITQAIVSDLTARLADIAARKKAEAAKDGPELPQGINLPRPGTPAEPATPPALESPVVPPAPK